MPEFEVIGRRRIVDGWAKLDELEYRIPGHEAQTRVVLEAGDASAVLLHDVARGELWFVRQLRVALGRHGDAYPLEIVAGKVDGDESPEQTALREVLEEVGHRLERLEPIVQLYPSPGILSEQVTVFYGVVSDETRANEGGGDDSEALKIEVLSTARAFELLDEGVIRDGKTVVALMWLRNRLS